MVHVFGAGRGGLSAFTSSGSKPCLTLFWRIFWKASLQKRRQISCSRCSLKFIVKWKLSQSRSDFFFTSLACSCNTNDAHYCNCPCQLCVAYSMYGSAAPRGNPLLTALRQICSLLGCWAGPVGIERSLRKWTESLEQSGEFNVAREDPINIGRESEYWC